MKRVCTLRKVIFYRSYISWLFIATQFLSSLKYLQPGDMIWNGKVTLNICMRKSFSRFYYHQKWK